MTTRVWWRQLVDYTYLPGDPNPSTNPELLQLTGGATDDTSVLVRTFLDLRASLVLKPNSGTGVVTGSWNQIMIMVGTGITAQGAQTPLLLEGGSDERVQGTGTMQFQNLYTADQGFTGYVATYGFDKTLETQGMRKTPVAGAYPFGNVTAQVYDPNGSLQHANDWGLQIFGWWRGLWETP